MNKQDLNGTRTAQDIERKYNLSGMQKNIEYNTQSIFQTNNELNNFIGETTENIENLQEQIDGQIMTWFYDGVPTLNNPPANEWTTDATKNKHLGDLYYDNLTGKAYRFAKQGSIFLWLEITDSDVTEALRIARAAKDTADGKRRVFTTTPNPPYDVGDLWSQGEDGDIKICVTAKTEGQIYSASDWEKASKYTDDSGLNNFINNTYSSTIQSLTNQIDGKAETWYQSTDPSLIWTTEEKARHIGDLWHNSSTNKSYIYDENKTWKEIDGVPDEVYDKIDGKAQVFSAQPTVPYYKKDLWVQGSNGDIYVCNNTRKTGNFNASDWIKASKYTDDTGLNNFIDVTFAESIQSLTNQIDGKVETWYYSGVPTLNNLPASSWSEEQRLKHIKDLYYDKETGYTYIFENDGQFKWTRIEDEDTIEALALANSAKDTADGKRRVFVSEPIPPYDNGDLWVQGEDGDIYVCQISRQEGIYQDGDFIIASKYTDDTVANAIVTELGGTETTVLHGSVLIIRESVDHYGIAINDHTEAIEELEEEVGNIVDTTGTAQGKYIHIEDSAEQPLISLELDGETTQETRSGKNKLKAYQNSGSATINGVTFTINDDTSITLNGTATGSGWFEFLYKIGSGTDKQTTPKISLDTSKSYTLSLKQLSGIITDTTSKLYIQYNEAGNEKSINLDGSNTTTISNSDGIYRAWIKIATNNVYTNYKIGMMIAEGTDTEYEPYGVMPSPDYPSEIKNITGRNLFNSENWYETLNNIDSTAIVKETINGVEYYKFRPDNSSIRNYQYMKGKFKSNTQYIISSRAMRFNNTTTSGFKIVYTDGTSTSSYISQDTEYDYTTISTINKTIDYICLAYANTGYALIRNIQLEESSTPSDYVPYDNIAVKVEGKNIWDEEWEVGAYTWSTGQKVSYNNCIRSANKMSCESNESYYVVTPSEIIIEFFDKDESFLGSATNFNPINSATFITPNNAKYLAFYTTSVYGNAYKNDIAIIKGTSGTYEPYKSQTAFFPLHGQKLMEGSYLADDGIHHKHIQILINIINNTIYTMPNGNKGISLNTPDKIYKSNNYLLCSKSIFDKNRNYPENSMYENPAGIMFVGNSEDTAETLKSKFNGAILEYELEEEEIIPYTTDQQEAWYNLLSLNTYKNVSNITSDAYAKIEYAKDNGLDIYETKDNAKRKYKVTEDKISQLIIDKNFIKTEVSNTKSSLENNYYTKDTADNAINGAIDGAKNDLNNIISQNKTEIEQTATQIAMRVSSIETNGVDKVTTSIGYTFDDEGLKINKTGAKTNSKLDEKGFSVKDSSSQDLFYAGYKEDGEYAGQTVVETSNLVVNNYLNVNGAGRFQPYVNPVLGGHGIGCFDIGGVQ